MKKRVISTLLCATMLVGMITGCGSNNTESAGNTSSNAASTESGDGEKVVLNVINYHVGTDYAADYYSYLFDAFQQTEEGKMLSSNLRKFQQQMHTIRKLNY